MDKLLLLGIYISSGLLLIALAIPLALGRVGPNSWYGMRTPKTLSHPTIWYLANRHAGRQLAGVGLTIVAGAIAFYFVPRWDLALYALANLAVVMGSLAYALARSFLYLRTIAPHDGD